MRVGGGGNQPAASPGPPVSATANESYPDKCRYSRQGSSFTQPERILRTMAITVPVTFPVATMSRPLERTGKLHLLVVDEDAAIRSACCEIASDLGFVPQTVSSIDAARTLLRDQGIDILLLDLRTPLEEGLGLLNEIKALNPGLAVVAMTAFATVPAAVEAMRTGATDYLTKPFAMDELTAVLERAVERMMERRNLDGASPN